MTVLYPPQQEILDHGIIDLGFSSVISLPTGAGKTTLAEMGMDRALARGERVAYLTPLKALAEEKIATWRNRWPDHKVGIFTGDYESSSTPVPYRDAEVIICTYERLDGVLRHWQRHLHWLSKLGLVVVDEFHLLMDPSRGPRLEGAISRLRRVNPFCRVMGLSATISNHAELAAWLDGVSYHSEWRPVPLEHEVRRFKRLADKAKLVIEIVAESAAEGGQTLVFASSRRRAEQLADQISAAGHNASHHHAGLGLANRKEVESNFRAGDLECLVATPTLEMGLNLPCRTVVLADNTRWTGDSFTPLPIWNYLQRAGRAGRPGQDGAGRAILIAPTWTKRLPDYGSARPEPIRSHLASPSRLAEQVLVEAASRSSRTRAQLTGSFLPSTLAHRQDPTISNRFEGCVDEMLDAGIMTEDESNILHPTAIGWITVRHQLSPATAKHLMSLTELNDASSLSDFDLILHHCWDGDLQPRLPVSIEIVDALEEIIQSISSCFLDTVPPPNLSPRHCVAGVLMAAIAWQFVQGQDLDQLCERLDIYPHDAGLLQQSLVRLLKASVDVNAALDPVTDPADQKEKELLCGPSLSSRIRRLALQLEYELPGNAAYLTRIPGCGGRLARRLLGAGITDLEDLCSEQPKQLLTIPGIGVKRAKEWIESANDLVKDCNAYQPKVNLAKPRGIATPVDWPTDIEPGRLSRAMSLEVRATGRFHWVSGGAEDHKVVDDHCDCADFVQHAPGWWCKHRLAVGLAEKNRRLKSLTENLSALKPPPTLAGHLADLALGKRWQHD